MTYADITDVSTRLGRPIVSTDEVAQVMAWLGDVEALIVARIPGFTDQVALGSPSTETVVMVESAAVIRKIKNPDGKQNEKIDDYSYGLTEAAARGDLFLTDDEWALLLVSSNTSQGAFTITPYGAVSTYQVPPAWSWCEPTDPL